MSSIHKPANAQAFANPAHAHPWRERKQISSSIASSKNYIFDLKSGSSLPQPAEEQEFVQPVSTLPKEQFHPADRDFALAARHAIIGKFADAALTNTPVRASMQFRVISPKGKVRLLNQILTPFAPGASSKHQVNIEETDLTNLATNPVKTVRIFFNEGEERTESTLKLNGFEPGANDCPFSDRQLQILRFLAEGRTTAEISKSLFISSDTVRTHRQHILQRSDQANMTATVVDCVRKGWV
ncbi:MAG: response regulator transcription factor [Saprospiraceae bacterium]